MKQHSPRPFNKLWCVKMAQFPFDVKWNVNSTYSQAVMMFIPDFLGQCSLSFIFYIYRYFMWLHLGSLSKHKKNLTLSNRQQMTEIYLFVRILWTKLHKICNKLGCIQQNNGAYNYSTVMAVVQPLVWL